jgi:hypothetical protein
MSLEAACRALAGSELEISLLLLSRIKSLTVGDNCTKHHCKILSISHSLVFYLALSLLPYPIPLGASHPITPPLPKKLSLSLSISLFSLLSLSPSLYPIPLGAPHPTTPPLPKKLSLSLSISLFSLSLSLSLCLYLCLSLPLSLTHTLTHS